MNDIERLDIIVGYLERTRSRIDISDIKNNLQLHISDDHAKYLLNILVNDGIVDKIVTGIGASVFIVQYTHNTQNFFDQGGYAKREEINRIAKEERNRLKQIENEKLVMENKLSKLQIKTFWPLFILALIGGICGIISLIISLTKT